MTLATESCPLDEALSRYLARDIKAAEDLPPFPRSRVDGFAVRSADTQAASPDAPVRLSLAGQVPAGARAERALKPGETMAVPTGGMMPAGTDAVAMAETAAAEADVVTLSQPLTAGKNMTAAGARAAAGQLLAAAGRRLDAEGLEALAAAGILAVDVFVPLQVGIISTGDELVDAGARPASGQIRDSNSHLLAALVRRSGAAPLRLGICRDDATALAAALAAAAKRCHLVLISGGSSAGAGDVTARVLRELAAGGQNSGIAPAMVNGTPVVGLPGPPARASQVYGSEVAPLIGRIYAAAAAGAP